MNSKLYLFIYDGQYIVKISISQSLYNTLLKTDMQFACKTLHETSVIYLTYTQIQRANYSLALINFPLITRRISSSPIDLSLKKIKLYNIDNLFKYNHTNNLYPRTFKKAGENIKRLIFTHIFFFAIHLCVSSTLRKKYIVSRIIGI